MTVTFRPPVAPPLYAIGFEPVPPGAFRVTRSFGDLSFPQYGPHDGLDVGNGRTHDPIVAMAPGRVTYAAFDPNSGGAGIVRIDHGEGWSSGYAHLDRIDVALGQQLASGQGVGLLGSTGWVTAAHLHFDISHNGTRLDPWPLLQENEVQYPRPMFPLALTTVAAGNNLRRTPSLTAEAKLLTVDATVGVHGVVTGEAWADKGTEWLWVGYAREMWTVHSALVGKLTPTVTLQTLGLAGDCTAQVTTARDATAAKAEAQTQAWVATRSPIVP